MIIRWVKEAGQFLRQVREEKDKVVWPTRREVVLTSIIVSIIAAMVSVFLLLVDQGVITFLRVLI